MGFESSTIFFEFWSFSGNFRQTIQNKNQILCMISLPLTRCGKTSKKHYRKFRGKIAQMALQRQLFVI